MQRFPREMKPIVHLNVQLPLQEKPYHQIQLNSSSFLIENKILYLSFSRLYGLFLYDRFSIYTNRIIKKLLVPKISILMVKKETRVHTNCDSSVLR